MCPAEVRRLASTALYAWRGWRLISTELTEMPSRYHGSRVRDQSCG